MTIKFFLLLSILSINIFAESIDQINKIAISGNINKALSLTKSSLKDDNNSSDLHILYAKLLFWNHNVAKAKREIKEYKKSAPKLYKQIYTTWAYEKLKQIKHPKSALKFIHNLPEFAKSSYDIRWIDIESNIKLKRFKQALLLTKKLTRKYPKSQEAQERLATLLFWNSKFKQSLSTYKSLYKRYKKREYKKQITKLSRIIKATKKRKIKKVQIVKAVKNKKKTTKVLVSKKERYMIGIGIKRSYYSDKRYKDITKYIEFTMPIKAWDIYVQIEKTARYGLNDFKIYSEIYPKMPFKNSWGYLDLSYAPNAKFFSKYTIGWHQYYNTSKLELGLGVEYSHYTSKNITIFNPELSYYFNSHLLINESIYYVPSNKSHAFVTKIDYKFNKHNEINAEFSFGNSYEKERVLTLTKEHKLKIGGEFEIGSAYTIGGYIGKKWFTRNGIKSNSAINELFVRKYW